jgi:hypothetical protein
LPEKVVEVEREKKSIQQEIAHKIKDARRRNVDDCLNKAAEIIRLQRKIEGLERDIEEHAALERDLMRVLQENVRLRAASEARVSNEDQRETKSSVSSDEFEGSAEPVMVMEDWTVVSIS